MRWSSMSSCRPGRHVEACRSRPTCPSLQLMSAAKIAVEGVSKQFDQAGSPVQALANVDLTIGEGEFVSIVGPERLRQEHAALHARRASLKPTRGRMLVDGEPITGPGVDRGVVFQEYALFPWLTVFDNIAYGLRDKRHAAHERYAPRRERLHRARRALPASSTGFRASCRAA